jgi:serine/threonine protein kinase
MSTTRGQHLIGKVLGSCVLERLLGYGGSSAVFLAQQHNPKRKVAVKVFLPRANMDAQMQKDFYNRFLREAEAASQLDHPNILPIYAYGEQDGLPYIVMPYMSGGTLSEYVAKCGALSLQEVQWYLEQIASALDYAHDHRCVHCDVKPANILIHEDGHVMLSDFGIAHISRDGVTMQVPPKTSDSLMGTPDYISPEQAMGHPLDGRSDIYSLGVTVFFLLANSLPFKADSSIALALLHVHEPPPSLALRRVDVSPALDRVVHRALAKKPEQRFQRASEFSDSFTEVLAQGEIVQEKLLTNEKRSKVLAGNPGYLGEQLQPTLIASDPVIRVKPLKKPLFFSPRLAIPAALLLTMVLIVVFTNFVLAHFSAQKPRPSGSLLTTGISSIPDSSDLLSHRQSWLSGDGTPFSYDERQRYHIHNKMPEDIPLISLYQGRDFTDVQLSVTMEEVGSPKNGANFYGIIFRSSLDLSQYYLFEVLTSGGGEYGEYTFLRYDGKQRNNPWKTLAHEHTPLLISGRGKSNTATIEARGNRFIFKINGESVGGVFSDTSKVPLKSGHIGLYVERRGGEVAFSHLYVKSL